MKKAKLNIPICAALVLLFLTMVSIHMTSGLYARYTATSTASDSARVAKFDVASDLKAIEGKNGEYALTISNTSEVAVEYRIEVKFESPMTVALDTGDAQKPTDGVVTFKTDSMTLKPNEGKVNHTLTFVLPDISYITKNAEGKEVSQALDFTVEVTAEQID